jgi:hypothetical protein
MKVYGRILVYNNNIITYIKDIWGSFEGITMYLEGILTPKEPKSLGGTIGSLGKFLCCQFSLWFFETLFEGAKMY